MAQNHDIQNVLLHSTNPGKRLKFKVWSLLNAACFHTIAKWKTYKLNYPKLGTVYTLKSAFFFIIPLISHSKVILSWHMKDLKKVN